MIALVIAGCSFTRPGGVPSDAEPDASSDGPPDAPPPDSTPRPGRRKQITIDPARVTGDQTAFPVWIALVDDELRMRAAANGADIHFRGAGGAPLAYQIQRWEK